MITENSHLHTYDVRYKSGKYGPFYEILMVDNEGREAITYIDDSFDNYWKWAKICNTPDTGYILTNCKQKTRYRKPKFTTDGAAIIDADSLPEILMDMPVDEMRQEIAWMLEDLQNTV